MIQDTDAPSAVIDKAVKEYDALLGAVAYLQARVEEYRIEADCGMRDYDGLEADAGIMHGALSKIVAKRPNKMFDPWAVAISTAALAEIKVYEGVAA